MTLLTLIWKLVLILTSKNNELAIASGSFLLSLKVHVKSAIIDLKQNLSKNVTRQIKSQSKAMMSHSFLQYAMKMVIMRNLKMILTLTLRRNEIKYSVNVGEN